jgi:carbon monoxide dehydrogenase subunit G
MLITETFSIDTPIQELYDFFLDAETVGSCVPGCESVDIIGDNEYDSIIETRVGTISAKFKVRTHISETVPCNLIRTSGVGKELRNLGQFKQKTEIALKELSADKTEVTYRAEVSIVGRLATFGDRIMKSKAKTMGKEFADAVKATLHPDLPADTESSPHVDLSNSNNNRLQQIIGAIISKIGQGFNWIFRLCNGSKKPT